jgi:hypothetical protein
MGNMTVISIKESCLIHIVIPLKQRFVTTLVLVVVAAITNQVVLTCVPSSFLLQLKILLIN